MTGPSTITITRHAPRVMAGPRKAPFTAWIVPGRDGQGINYTDSVATYDDLPTDLTGADRGAGYFVVDEGLLYSWNGATFPAQGDGLPIQGEPGPQGRGIEPGGVSVVGTQLRFLMNDGSTDAVTIPAIQQAIDSAAAASSSATAAGTARDAAQAAASTAGTAATTAVGARDAAQTARTGAEAARDIATTAATAADNSADAAALSEANADTSETNAANSAGAAATSATQADAAADDADAARVAAVAAQTAAQGSATTAGNSASAAATSADDAQDSATAAAASAAEAADVVTSGIPNATDTVKGGIRLTGDLGGTWDAPTVPGLAGKADLVGGKVPVSQIPAQALVERRVVANTAARLALTDVQEGDVAIQTGNPGRGTYILGPGSPSLEDSWSLFVVPDSPVSSVNGYTGIVILGKADVGLGNVDNTADIDKPISTAVAAALDGKVDEVATANVAYGTKTGGVQGTWPVTSAATATTLALRGTGGTVAVGDATAAGHAASKGQLDTGLSGKAATAHSHAAADIASGTLDVARLPVGTGSTQVAAGNDSRIVNAVPNTRTVSAGTGLSGGGDLTANRTLSVQYGTAAGTAAQGNDARLSDARTPTDLSVTTSKLADASVTIPKLGADVVPGIQGMIDASIAAAQRITVNAQAGAYTLVAADANKAIEVTSATAVNLTIPTDAAVTFPIGTVIEVNQIGAGKVTIVGASGVTVQAPVTPTTRAQYSAVVLRKRAANLWLVSGDM
ncbi:minor tail protein [Gordonia phage Hans]|nr:minor tail protein [Gordonia phage Hans]